MDEETIQSAETGSGSFQDGWEEDGGSAGGEREDRADREVGGQTREAGEETAFEAGEMRPGGDRADPEQPPRTWTLNHLGQTVTAGEADMVALARKGLDYDRVCRAYEEGRPVLEMFRDFAGRSGMSVGDYLAHIRIQAKQSQGMSEREARRAVELENREAAVAAREQAGRQQSEEARRRADIREFMEAFPEAAGDPGSIPPEVWAEVRGGRSLVAAYARYQAARLRIDREAARRREAVRQQNAENTARSAGSMRSAGFDGGIRDPFLEGWGE